MRKQIKNAPYHGDIRTKSKYLWFPKMIHREFRWLERAKWIDEYVMNAGGAQWFAREWLDAS